MMRRLTKIGICKYCGGQLKQLSEWDGRYGRTHQFYCLSCKKKISGVE
jgi:hypothetical protein